MNNQFRTFRFILLVLCLFILVFSFSGCSSSSEDSGVSIEAPTLPPEWTATASPPLPTSTKTSTATSQPSPTSSCHLASILKGIKELVPYNDFSVHHNVISGISTLVIWFVDPNLNTNASQEAIAEVVQQAKIDSVELIHQVSFSTPCASDLFDVINTIIVDSNYVGWLSSQLSPSDLPGTTGLSIDERNDLISRLTVVFERSAPVQEYLPGSCTWNETKERLYYHFSFERHNVAFYYVIDDYGQNIWAQWDGPADPLMVSLNVGNILLESECFPPQANIFIIIVDDMGVAQFIGIIPQMQVDNMQVVYSK